MLVDTTCPEMPLASAIYQLYTASIDKCVNKHFCSNFDTWLCAGHGQVLTSNKQYADKLQREWYADNRKHQRDKYQQMHVPAGSGACEYLLGVGDV